MLFDKKFLLILKDHIKWNIFIIIFEFNKLIEPLIIYWSLPINYLPSLFS